MQTASSERPLEAIKDGALHRAHTFVGFVSLSFSLLGERIDALDSV